jgi:isopenicillin-N N-acyltransferase like protein
MTPLELPTVEVRGTPIEMGRAQGFAFGSKLQAFIDMRMDAAQVYLVDRGPRGIDDLLQAGERCYEALARWHPSTVVEHEAMCNAAGVDVIALFTAANMTDVRDVLLLSGNGPHGPTPDAEDEGCTAVLVPDDRAVGGQTLVGQTWDLNVGDLDFVVALHRVPVKGPEAWTITVMGAPALMGLNAAGVAVGTTNIKTWRSRPGVGYLNILQRALQSQSREEAAKIIENAPRSGAHTYWLADAAGFVEYEATPWSFTKRDSSAGTVCRTNHCIAPAHRVLEGEAPSASSGARMARAEAWVAQHNQDVDSLRRLFGDRSDGADSINRLPEDDQGTATNAVMIAIPERLELWACRGPADRGAWLKLPFDYAGARGSIEP